MSNSVQLDAGPELDAAVAEAVGLKCDVRRKDNQSLYGDLYLPNTLRDFFGNGKYQTCGGCGPDGQHYEWSPSTDMNDAMEAAEKVGLFRKYSLSQTDSWHVYVWDSMPDLDLSLATGPTAAVAICRAILELSRK